MFSSGEQAGTHIHTPLCIQFFLDPPSRKLQRLHPPHNEINILLRSCLQIFLIKKPFDSLAIWPEPKKVLIKEAQIRSEVTPSLGQGPWKVVIVDFTKVVSSDPPDKLKHILLFLTSISLQSGFSKGNVHT